MKHIAILFILALLPAVYTQTCAQPSSSDQIETGSYSLSNQSPGRPRLHVFNINLNSISVTNAGFEVAVSTSSINGYNPSSGFDYKVNGGKRQNGNALVLAVHINEDASWTSMRVSFLVSNYNEIIVGSFIGDPFFSTNTAGYPNDQGIIQTRLPLYRFKQQSEYGLAIFVSGMRTDDNSFSLYLLTKAIDKVQGRLVVQFQSNANPQLQILQITYVVYPLNHELYNFEGNVGTYTFDGPQFFQNQAITNKRFAICKKSGGSTPQTNCASGQYFVGGKCYCLPGTIEVEGVCRSPCGQNAYYNQYNQCVCLPNYSQNYQGLCVESGNCSPNQILIANGRCACKQGYLRLPSGECQVSCAFNEIFNGQICVCKNGYYKNAAGVCEVIPTCGPNSQFSASTYVCQCNPGFVRDFYGQCNRPLSCQANQQIVSGQCVCVNGFYKSSRGICERIPTCGANQEFSIQTQTCQCKAGYVRNSNGQCTLPISCKVNEQVVNGQCVCVNGFVKNASGVCVRQVTCPLNEQFNAQIGACDCKSGFTRVGPTCLQRCSINQVWINNNCQCKDGTARINYVCRACPAGSNPNTEKDTCICTTSGYIFDTQTSTCVRPANCQANASRNTAGVCVCNSGFYPDGNSCLPVPTCPPNSVWNQSLLSCVCTNPNLHLISGACKSCGTNQIWNGSACICGPQTYKISGVCRSCDPRSTYNGLDCLCNVGFYGNRDLCQPCHTSCGKCRGPGANECTACIDISYTLADGYCTKVGPCEPGHFLGSKGVCESCQQNCRSCTTADDCQTCENGFELKKQVFGGQTLYYCNAICGDGRKNGLYEQCDDGNLKNGDGCDSSCLVENGWQCYNGTSLQKSVCQKGQSPRSIIQVKGAVNNIGRVLQSIRLSYIPPCMSQNDCAECFKILKVSVNSAASSYIQVNVNYIPNSGGQFLVQFAFPPGVIVTTAFIFTVQINDNLPSIFNGCFTKADLDQRVTKTLDPATLILASSGNNQLGALDLFSLNNPTTPSNSISYTPEILTLLNNQN